VNRRRRRFSQKQSLTNFANRRRSGNNDGKRLPQLVSAWRLSGFAQLKFAIKTAKYKHCSQFKLFGKNYIASSLW